MIDKDSVLWKDRKRYFGLPISFTKYFISNERLYIEKGLLKTEINETLLYRVLDIKSTRTLFQKLFGVGTVILFCADQSNRTLELENVKDSISVHEFISEIVEKERQNKGIAGREIVGTAGVDMDHVDGCCDAGNHQEDFPHFDDFKND